ncbi:MAG: DUF805 domain-containing protein [Sphingobacteriia bacterium]|nr:DUF805 domain-containing protein [Sphingobacteriia bacterium]
MGFIQAIQSAYLKVFDFSGRASRSEYWYFVLFTFILGFLYGMIGVFNNTLQILLKSYIISVISFIIMSVPYYTVSVRRLHDINFSGNWIIPLIIFDIIQKTLSTFLLSHSANPTIIMVVIVICIAQLFYMILMAQPGTKSSNKYGPNPLDKTFQKIEA